MYGLWVRAGVVDMGTRVLSERGNDSAWRRGMRYSGAGRRQDAREEAGDACGDSVCGSVILGAGGPTNRRYDEKRVGHANEWQVSWVKGESGGTGDRNIGCMPWREERRGLRWARCAYIRAYGIEGACSEVRLWRRGEQTEMGAVGLLIRCGDPEGSLGICI